MNPKSYTQWGKYKTCPAQYNYQYKEKLPIPPKTKSDAATRGTYIHGLVESFLKGEIDTFPEEEGMPDLSFYQSFFEMLRGKGAKAEVEFQLDHDWEWVEKGDVATWVRGFIDVLVPMEPTAYIYELKSGQEWDDHVEQRAFYGPVPFAMNPDVEEVKVIGLYLDKNFNRENTYSRSKRTVYKWMWNGRLEQLDNTMSYAANPGNHCSWCPFSKDKGGPCKFSGD